MENNIAETIYLKYMDTPVGRMRMGASDEGICLFEFEYRRSLDNIMKRVQSSGKQLSEGEHPHFKALEEQVSAYFAGTLQEFHLPLDLIGTPFQKSVWQALLQIPYGTTRTYKKQSVFLGNEKAIRAVASANGENGIAIIIPCHRVIGTNGSLTGYGGGLPTKKWLLEHEAKYSGRSGQSELF